MPESSYGKMFASAILSGIAGPWVATVKSEVEIAKIEFERKSKELGKGIALVAVAATFAFFMAMVLIASAVLALSLALEPWVAALIVAGGLLFWVVVLGWWGGYKIKKNKDLVPKRAINNIKGMFGS